MRRFVPDEFHEPFRRFAFDFKNDFTFELPQPVVREKERDENRRDADGHKPFVADVAGRMKGQPFLRQLVVKLLDQRLEQSAVELETELGDFSLQQLVIAQTAPVR